MSTVNTAYLKSTDSIQTLYNITIGKVSQIDLLLKKTNFVFPRFSNNDDELCPLVYTMSESNLIYKEYTGLQPLTVSNDGEQL